MYDERSREWQRPRRAADYMEFICVARALVVGESEDSRMLQKRYLCMGDATSP